MNSRDRAYRALNHQEPDHVPMDLGGTGLTTIHLGAYQALRQHLNMPRVEARIMAMALFTVSWYSRAGSESATIPAPTWR